MANDIPDEIMMKVDALVDAAMHCGRRLNRPSLEHPGEKMEAARTDLLATIARHITPAPPAWCQPMDNGIPSPRTFIVRYDDADVPDAVFDNEAEARDHWQKASTHWNCYLFGAMPLDAASPADEAPAIAKGECTAHKK